MQTAADALQEVLGLEERYWNAIKQKDAATAVSLSDDPCLVVGAQGVAALDRATLGKMMREARYELRAFSIEDMHTRQISEDVVAVAYKAREELLLDGQTVPLEVFDASVWVRRGDRWVCALHTESLAGDPFGRR